MVLMLGVHSSFSGKAVFPPRVLAEAIHARHAAHSSSPHIVHASAAVPQARYVLD
jgi:hypothetical protein